MMLKLDNICGGYIDGNHILKGVNLSVQRNEVLGIIGQNGCGKSTLMKSIMNMLPIRSGLITLNDSNINDIHPNEFTRIGIGYFMQGGRVFPQLTVKENLIFAGMKSKHTSSDWIEYLDNNVLAGFDDQYYSSKATYLSGGEKHKLALSMVLMQKPKLLLLDEPSAGLSPANVRELYTILNKIRTDFQVSMLLIEQNVNFAYQFCDRVTLLQKGRILKEAFTKEEVKQSYFN